MKIYSMTATFGKLEHQTLHLEPGLNIIERPNEWGKSTWCAFLVNMLYGLDTKEKDSKNGLADKNRYKPWSGAPMSGRIDLNWNGRDITIERRTSGRLVFGEFSAYETNTGLPVPELNGTNCGQMLLGVERSVFTRAGFLKLADLPVTQDDALRRRLNSLVTTGDESGTGDKLGSSLRELKNKCRYNKTGLLPQAEMEKMRLENQLQELQSLQQEILRLKQQHSQKEVFLADLQNHKAALQYASAKDDAQKVADAEQAQAAAQAEYETLVKLCEDLPELETAQKALQEGQALQQRRMELQLELQQAPALQEPPAAPACFRELTPQDAVAQVMVDTAALDALQQQKKQFNSKLWIGYVLALAVGLGLAAAGFFWMPVLYIAAGVVLAASVAGMLIFTHKKNKGFQGKIVALSDKYSGLDAALWVSEAEKYLQTREAYDQAVAEVKAQRQVLEKKSQDLDAQLAAYTHGADLKTCLERFAQIVANRNALTVAQKDWLQAQRHAQALRSMLKPVAKPTREDALSYSAEQTDALLNSTTFDLKQLHLKLGQYEGRAESLGQESVIRTQLKAISRRIAQLEDTYAALELALTALNATTTELQRRFAPRISKRAQELFSKLTGQRYDRLSLSSDLSLNAGAQEEDTLRPAQHRSDGTVDQLYLALRLSVAEELTPNAPLVLDDALVRFDDTRLAAAMDILRTLGENKQVILFTCQSRESRL